MHCERCTTEQLYQGWEQSLQAICQPRHIQLHITAGEVILDTSRCKRMILK